MPNGPMPYGPMPYGLVPSGLVPSRLVRGGLVPCAPIGGGPGRFGDASLSGLRAMLGLGLPGRPGSGGAAR